MKLLIEPTRQLTYTSRFLGICLAREAFVPSNPRRQLGRARWRLPFRICDNLRSHRIHIAPIMSFDIRLLRNAFMDVDPKS